MGVRTGRHRVAVVRLPAGRFRELFCHCGGLYVPTGLLPLEERFDGHLVIIDGRPSFTGRRFEEPVRIQCDPQQASILQSAADVYRKELTDAHTELLVAHGAQAELSSYLTSRLHHIQQPPWPARLPGWRHRAETRSTKAQIRLFDRMTAALERYQPVWDEIEQRREQALAEERELQQRREESLKALRLIAWLRVWAYAPVDDSAVLIYRNDVRPAGPIPSHPGPRGGWLTLERVHDDMWSRRGLQPLTLIWDSAACAAVERHCGQWGVSATFRDWWQRAFRSHSLLQPYPDGPPGTYCCTIPASKPARRGPSGGVGGFGGQGVDGGGAMGGGIGFGAGGC